MTCATRLTGLGTDQNKAPSAIFVHALPVDVSLIRKADRMHRSFVESRPALLASAAVRQVPAQYICAARADVRVMQWQGNTKQVEKR